MTEVTVVIQNTKSVKRQRTETARTKRCLRPGYLDQAKYRLNLAQWRHCRDSNVAIVHPLRYPWTYHLPGSRMAVIRGGPFEQAAPLPRLRAWVEIRAAGAVRPYSGAARTGVAWLC